MVYTPLSTGGIHTEGYTFSGKAKTDFLEGCTSAKLGFVPPPSFNRKSTKSGKYRKYRFKGPIKIYGNSESLSVTTPLHCACFCATYWREGEGETCFLMYLFKRGRCGWLRNAVLAVELSQTKLDIFVSSPVTHSFFHSISFLISVMTLEPFLKIIENSVQNS